jgi:hypothetical protein
MGTAHAITLLSLHDAHLKVRPENRKRRPGKAARKQPFPDLTVVQRQGRRNDKFGITAS